MYIYDINKEGLDYIAHEILFKCINGEEMFQYDDVLKHYANKALYNLSEGNAPDIELSHLETKSGCTELIRLDLDTHFDKEKIDIEDEE